MIVYGFVVNNTFYSENMKAKLRSKKANGLYQLDLKNPNYIDGIEFADITKFNKYIKTSKKILTLTGFTFHRGFIPLDYIKWLKKGINVPINLLNPESCGEWQVIRVYYILSHKVFIFGEWLTNPMQITLFLIRDQFKNGLDLDGFKTVTPEMRILYSLHSLEKIKQEQMLVNLKAEEYKRSFRGRLQLSIQNAGGEFVGFNQANDGVTTVTWKCMSERITTILDKDLKVMTVGFCVSGYDNTQSIGSAVNLLQQYKDQGDYIHKTVVEDE